MDLTEIISFRSNSSLLSLHVITGWHGLAGLAATAAIPILPAHSHCLNLSLCQLLNNCMAVLMGVYLSLFEVDDMILPWSSMVFHGLPWSSMLLDFVVHFQYRIA